VTAPAVDDAALVRDGRIHVSLDTDPRVFADAAKKVVLINAAEPLPNLGFLL